jgi:hypothetical protein
MLRGNKFKMYVHRIARLSSLVAFAFCAFPFAEVFSQESCPCATPQTFACQEKSGDFPGDRPGSAVVASTAEGASLYVATLFDGFTYRYNAAAFDSEEPVRLRSPGGSATTTGLAFRQGGPERESFLYWAIAGEILQTDLEGTNTITLATPDMEALGLFFRSQIGDDSVQRGTLGGIAYHAGKNSLWAVDIVNDLYWELGRFSEAGSLTLETSPAFFLNPKRNALTGGAYGNSIAYVANGSGEFFDIPVGSLTDGRPIEVHRVRATDGAGSETFKIGDATGVFYDLGAALEAPEFVTGIASWSGSCGADQTSQFVLDVGQEGPARIFQVAADDPTVANVADFKCRETGAAQVSLFWRKTLPYTELRITRRLLTTAGAPAVSIYTNVDFAADPGTTVDVGVPDGSYEYVATVTAASSVPPIRCALTLGAGSVVAHRRFAGLGTSADPVPYAITLMESDTIVVADMHSGDAETFDLDLEPKGFINAPSRGGLITGLAYNSADNQLYWLENNQGRHTLHVTDLTGDPVGVPEVPVDSPLALDTGTSLGDLSYDPISEFFWTVDVLNGVLYGVTTAGAIPGAFAMEQLANPETDGFLSGGVVVATGTDQRVVLDIGLGQSTTGSANELGRFSYARDSLSDQQAGQRFDLWTSTGAAKLGGVAVLDGAVAKCQYVVGVDTRTIYKLSLTGETGPLTYRRGDVNNDTSLNISDPSALVVRLFRGGGALPCERAADADGSETVNISDAIYIFEYLFKAGPPPAEPFTACGVTPDSTLPCENPICVDK